MPTWRLDAAVAAGVLILLLPAVLVALNYPSEIQLEPQKFLEEYGKFLGTLVSVFVAFWLVNVYWASVRGRFRTRQLRHVFASRLKDILQRTLAATEAMEVRVGLNDDFDRRSNQVRDAIGDVELAWEGIDALLLSNGVELATDPLLENRIREYVATNDAFIRVLAERKKEIFPRPPIMEALSSLRAGTATAISLIEERSR